MYLKHVPVRLSFGVLGTHFNEIWIKLQTFSLTKTKLNIKILTANWRSFSRILNVFIGIYVTLDPSVQVGKHNRHELRGVAIICIWWVFQQKMMQTIFVSGEFIVFNLESGRKGGAYSNIPVEHHTNNKLHPCKEIVQTGDTYDTIEESVIGRTDDTECHKGKSCFSYIMYCWDDMMETSMITL